MVNSFFGQLMIDSFFFFWHFHCPKSPCLFHSAAGSRRPEVIDWSDDKLDSKRRDSPGMGFYYLKGFSYSRTDQNSILHDQKL